jgi:hypothetical protein
MNIENQSRTHSPEEMQSLKSLREVLKIFSEAVNSLDQNSFTSPEKVYLAWAALTAYRAGDGYLLLRDALQMDASKLLIRPILEAMFSSSAVMSKRGFLFRKAYTEILEEKKFHSKHPVTDAQLDNILTETERLFKKNDPKYPIERKRVDIAYTAKVAGMLPTYEVVYRIYCQFTHGAISAASGQLNDTTDNLDTQIVAHMLITILELLKKHTNAKVPDIAQLSRSIPKPKDVGETFPSKHRT